MIYCDHCVMPNTRPGINFTKDKEGKNICSACINHKNKENIDYKKQGLKSLKSYAINTAE